MSNLLSNLSRSLTLAARAQRGRGTQQAISTLFIRDRNNKASSTETNKLHSSAMVSISQIL